MGIEPGQRGKEPKRGRWWFRAVVALGVLWAPAGAVWMASVGAAESVYGSTRLMSLTRAELAQAAGVGTVVVGDGADEYIVPTTIRAFGSPRVVSWQVALDPADVRPAGGVRAEFSLDALAPAARRATLKALGGTGIGAEWDRGAFWANAAGSLRWRCLESGIFVLIGLGVARLAERRRFEGEGVCAACGYELGGLRQCPECGAMVGDDIGRRT